MDDDEYHGQGDSCDVHPDVSLIMMTSISPLISTCAGRAVEQGDSVEPHQPGVHPAPGQGQADGDGGHQVPLHAGGEDQAFPGGDIGEREEQEQRMQE